MRWLGDICQPLSLGAHDNDALPSQQGYVVGLRQHAPLELTQEGVALLQIRRVLLELEQAIELTIGILALVGRLFDRKITGQLIGRLVNGIALERRCDIKKLCAKAVGPVQAPAERSRP